MSACNPFSCISMCTNQSDDVESIGPQGQTIDQRSGIELYKAAVKGDWRMAKKVINRNRPTNLTGQIDDQKRYTALHVAAGAQHAHFVKAYLQEMENLSCYQRIRRICFMYLPPHETPNEIRALLNKRDIDGNNPFCLAVAAGSVKTAKVMVGMDRDLLNERGFSRRKPLYIAALFGHANMVNYLYDLSICLNMESNEDELRAVFFTSIESGLFGFALKLLNNRSSFALARVHGHDSKTALHLLAQKPSTIVSGNPSHALLKCLLNIVKEKDLTEIRGLIRSPSHLLFDAVESGNTELVLNFIDACPNLIWETDAENRTIIHAAILRRDARIFNLIHEIGYIKNVIVTYTDNRQNNMLHLAAQLAPTSQLNKVPGAAFQMQRELLWFEEVKKSMHPANIESKNFPEIQQQGNAQQQEGKTPQELFTVKHEGLLKEGRKWMHETARSCTIVSTLITSALFASGIAVTQETTNHLKQGAYQIFIISEAMAFLLAIAATITFLAILTSRYAERDFLKVLPFKLRMGFALLFLSILGMMVTFFIAYGRKYFLPAIVTISAVFSMVLYVYLQFSLLKDIFGSTCPF